MESKLDIKGMQSENATIFYMKSELDAPILKMCSNGDIFVKGKLIENDKELTDALREFLKSQGFLK